MGPAKAALVLNVCELAADLAGRRIQVRAFSTGAVNPDGVPPTTAPLI